MRRFFTRVAVEDGPAGARVLLDGRPILTPERRPLVLPTAALAAAVAQEWDGQGETIRPALMPLTRLATTAADRMPARRGDAIEEVAGYALTDLLCYRVDRPAELALRQERLWQPWLDWLRASFGVRLLATRELDPAPQPDASLAALRGTIEAVGDWPLVGLHAATRATGSLVLGLALLRDRIDAATAFEVAQLEELYEIERWGEEREQQRRHAALRAELAATQRFLRLLEA